MTGSGKHSRDRHRFRRVGTLRSPAGFDQPVAVSAGPDGPVALWASAADRDELLGRSKSAGGVTFPRTRSSSQPRVALTSYRGESLTPDAVVVVDNFPLAHVLVQPLPGGRFLVAGARCAWRAETPEQNALLVGEDGRIIRSGTFGDGIAQMLVDDTGDTWIGYFDEGVAGNFGWGGPGPTPLGAAGIVRWSTRFEKRWEYQAVDRYSIDDCHALNVDGARAWACPYADFPLLSVEAGNVTVHPTSGVSGARGLVVAGSTVAFIGSYKSRHSLRLGGPGNLHGLRSGELVLPNGRRAPNGHLVCRGRRANLFVGSDWFVFDLGEIL